jgi:hypothetical protein
MGRASSARLRLLRSVLFSSIVVLRGSMVPTQHQISSLIVPLAVCPPRRPRPFYRPRAYSSSTTEEFGCRQICHRTRAPQKERRYYVEAHDGALLPDCLP